MEQFLVPAGEGASEYTENGIELDAIVDETLFGRLRQYVTEEV